MKIVIAGIGAFGIKHLEAIQNIENAEVVGLIDPEVDKAKSVGGEYGIARIHRSLEEALYQPEVDALILCSPTQMHTEQAIACMKAGKHVQIEIPLADSLDDALAIAEAQRASGLVCMVGHTRRYNPSHHWLHQSIERKERAIQQMVVQTYFFRRRNINANGEPRSWTDHLLWHHAAHTVDLFQYQTGEPVAEANAIQGTIDSELGIALDMSIQLKTTSGKICTLSLSFNNEGPLGTVFRYICDQGTFTARYDDLVDGYENPIDLSAVAVSMNGIELQDRDFISAIENGHEPRASIQKVLPCYHILHDLEQQLAKQN